MICAIINNNIVENIAEAGDGEILESHDLVLVGDIPVSIGDTYDGEHFYRDGERLFTPLEVAQNTLVELDAAILDATYAGIIDEFEYDAQEVE